MTSGRCARPMRGWRRTRTTSRCSRPRPHRRSGAFKGWTAAGLGGITAPTLLVFGDHDFVRLEHAAHAHELIPGAQLAVLPGATHMGVLRRADLALLLVGGFLG